MLFYNRCIPSQPSSDACFSEMTVHLPLPHVVWHAFSMARRLHPSPPLGGERRGEGGGPQGQTYKGTSALHLLHIRPAEQALGQEDQRDGEDGESGDVLIV